MKIINKLPYIIVAGLSWIVIISSCANQGMPTGGPRDTIPPVLITSQPAYHSVNYKGKEVRLTFNEFIIPDKISEALVVSPPLKKRPTILTKSKTLIIRFNEILHDSTTYSLDFKDAVVDNNEQNPYKNLRFSFSTGSNIDTLRVAGKVINSFNLEPINNTLVTLYKNLHDSAIYTLQPDYIAKTDKDGNFLFDNITEGQYHIFSINDMNNDMLYNEGAEEISFHDSLIIPKSEYHEKRDTLATGTDSLLISGHTHFLPGPIFMRQFTEDIYEQYLKTSKRNSPYQFTFVFNESVKDSFNITLTDTTLSDWYILEPNEKYDSLTVWLSDTTLASQESLQMELEYLQVDSTNQFYLQKDTVNLQFTKKEEETKKRKKRKEEKKDSPRITPQFNWSSNIKSTGFDLNKDILLTVPQPIKHLNTEAINLYLSDDTLKTPLNFKFFEDSTAYRSYRLSYNWEPGTNYTLEIDSAACKNVYHITSKELTSSFKTKKEDFYGAINISLTGVECPIIVQLLENNDGELVITEKRINKDKTVIFNYLSPDKYRIKLIFDENNNGKYDTGSFQDKMQPEKVAYMNKVIKVRSNWDNILTWDLKNDISFIKNIVDKELEEQKRKEKEEKRKKEREKERNRQQRDFSSPVGGLGGGLPTRF